MADGVLQDEIRRRVEAWRALMTRHATQARQLLRKMLRGRLILFQPTEEHGEVGYRFRGEASVSELLAGLAGLPLMVTSPTGTAPLRRPTPIVRVDFGGQCTSQHSDRN